MQHAYDAAAAIVTAAPAMERIPLFINSPENNKGITTISNVSSMQSTLQSSLLTEATTNLTQFANKIYNYSLNFMDAGIDSNTNTTILTNITPLSTATSFTTTATTTTTTTILYINTNSHIAPTNPPSIEDDEIRLLHAPQLSQSTMIKVYVLAVIALLSMLGNLLTMWNIYKTRLARRNSRHSWSAIYSLIFHLSIADVLVTGFCIIGDAAWYYTVQWLADELTCKLVKLFQMFSLYLSTYVLVLIGVDRWIAVKYPMKSLNMAKRCYRLLAGIYILSFVLSLPQFFIFHVARGPFIEEFHQCVTHGFYTADWQEQFYTTFTLVFTFLLPLCILFGTYLSTFCTISNSEKMFQSSKLASYSSKQPAAQTNRQRLIHKAKMKSLRISVVIIIAFIICWTPYYVMMMIFMFWKPDTQFSEDLQSGIFFFGMSNSLVNPLIYGAFHLCPMGGRASKKANNNNATYSLNRGDSQRTSMLTAVTQIDNNGRHIRTTYRQPSYYRSQSNGSGNYKDKEHVSLLQVTPTSTTLIRKSASLRNSPHPIHNTQIIGTHNQHLHPHHSTSLHQYNQQQKQKQELSNSTNLLCNGKNVTTASTAASSSHSTIVFSYDNKHRSGCHSAGNIMSKHIPSNSSNNNAMGASLFERHDLIGVDENISSV